ncbi:hypothetical protein Y032_0110g179 [Ancylostoma ceylanicum]|uniref:Uncharacterized protein n=1 Tax=Ancylostoma ceylanicum TaxID=53326 RepID=A0A016TEM1_9BILA|nr:hypothetical protein Y032_0110g179 [Ancylostoma ceylanicum]
MRVRLSQAVVKTPGFGSADGAVRKAPEHEFTEWVIGTPCLISEEKDRVLVLDGGWVRRGPVAWEAAEFESPIENGSALAEGSAKLQGTGSPWPSSGEIDRIRAAIEE